MGSLHSIGCWIGGLILFGGITLILGLVMEFAPLTVLGGVALVAAAVIFPLAIHRLRRELRGIAREFERKREDFADREERDARGR